MTNFERIVNMSADELAESAAKEMRIFIMADPVYMSLLDATIHPTKEAAVVYNKKQLESEVKE